MNPSTYSAAGSGVALLGEVIEWACHWPLTAPSAAQSQALAGLALALVASVHGMLNARKQTTSGVEVVKTVTADAAVPVEKPQPAPTRPSV